MDTVLVHISDNKAYKLLENPEELQILKVIKKITQQTNGTMKPHFVPIPCI
jgi:hypothetical protein